MWIYQEGPAGAHEPLASTDASPSGVVGRKTVMPHLRNNLFHVEATAGSLLSCLLLERKEKTQCREKNK